MRIELFGYFSVVYDQYVKLRRFTQVYALWVHKTKFYTSAPFPPQTEILGRFLTGLNKFSFQQCLNNRDTRQ